MATSLKNKNTITLKGLVELFGFPTLPELIIDGVNLDETLYRKLLVRLAARYFETAQLSLSLAGEDEFLVEPAQGGEWEDAAYWLGNLINQAAGQVKVNAPSDLLRRGREGREPYADLASAVLGNLGSLSQAPQAFGFGSPAEALRKAAENALEVKKVRELVNQEAAGW